MKVIICIDDNQGMSFNNRRQSTDGKVIEDIADITKELWISPFSESLFKNVSTKYPSDFKLDLNLSEWKQIESIDFIRNSHKKITREIYVK